MNHSSFPFKKRPSSKSVYRDLLQRDWAAIRGKLPEQFMETVHTGRKRIHKKIHRTTKKPWFWQAFGSVVLLGLSGILIWVSTLAVPSIDSFSDRKTSNSTTIYDRTGKIILYDVIESAERTAIESEKISSAMKSAMIAAEDIEFYTHKGIRLSSTLRGVFTTTLSKLGLPVQGSGGSTITQQVIKNTILTSDKSVVRKVKEWILAVKLEKVYEKDQILTMYLNEVPFGGNVYGIEAASRHFYNKSAIDLSVAESSYLAAIVNRPSYLSPYGKHLDVLEGRKNYVLGKMLATKKIDQTTYDAARAEKVVFTEKKDNQSKAIHFVEYVRSIIERQYGVDAMTEGGFKVITTLDWKIQEKAQEYTLKRALENEKAYNASNAAVVAIAPSSGDILAMVGSRSYEDKYIDGKFNVALAKRQPGSSFKAIVYATAFEMGYTPDTKLFDVETQFGSGCASSSFETTTNGSCYAPNNYDGEWKGLMTLRSALGGSRNIPAVKLLYLVTPANSLRLAKTLGMQSLGNASRYGLTLVLGGGEVRLVDITGAYAAFANDGVYTQPHGILSIESKSTGKKVYTHTPRNVQALSSQAARQLNSVLSDDAARRPLFGGAFSGMGAVALKTGTTNNNRDAWLIGYTPDIAVGVWCGNNDNKPMTKGSSIAINLWRDVMYAGFSSVGRNSSFTAPLAPDPVSPAVLRGHWQGNESFVVDTVSGKLATDMTPVETRKEFVFGTPHTILHYVRPGDARSGAGSVGTTMYNSWEYGIQKWIASNPESIPEAAPEKPIEYDDIHTEENKPKISLLNQNLTMQAGGQYTLDMQTTGLYPVKQLEVYMNDELIVKTKPSQMITIQAPEATGRYVLRLVAVDEVWNRGQFLTDVVVE